MNFFFVENRVRAREVMSEGEIDRGRLVIALREMEGKVKVLEERASADSLKDSKHNLEMVSARGVRGGCQVASTVSP